MPARNPGGCRRETPVGARPFAPLIYAARTVPSKSYMSLFSKLEVIYGISATDRR